MDEEKLMSLTPYQLNRVMAVASKITNLMTNGVWHMTFEEMEIALEMVHYGIERSKEERNVSE